MKEFDTDVLEDFKENLEVILGYMPKTKLEFMGDPKTQDAVYMRLQYANEIMRKFSDKFRARHPELPWNKLRGLRNVIAHEYSNLDAEVIWNLMSNGDFNDFADSINKLSEEIK